MYLNSPTHLQGCRASSRQRSSALPHWRSRCRGPFSVFGDLSFFLEKQEERFSVPSIVVIDRLRQKEQCFPCTEGENLSRHIILEHTLDY